MTVHAAGLDAHRNIKLSRSRAAVHRTALDKGAFCARGFTLHTGQRVQPQGPHAEIGATIEGEDDAVVVDAEGPR